MIRVEFTEPLGDQDWKKWRSNADSKTTRLREDFDAERKYTISESLYKQMRQVFLDAVQRQVRLLRGEDHARPARRRR